MHRTFAGHDRPRRNFVGNITIAASHCIAKQAYPRRAIQKYIYSFKNRCLIKYPFRNGTVNESFI